MRIVITLLTSFFLISNSSAVMIQAQETPDKFIKTTELLNGYTFQECQSESEEIVCSPLLNSSIFLRSELNQISDQNARYVLYSTVGDGAAIVGGFFIGMYAGLFGAAAYLGYHGAPLALSAFLYGALPGTIAGAGSTLSLDVLDPFIYRDTSIAFDAVIGIADEDDLEDVEAYEIDDELVVVIEDINFKQLKSKVIRHLKSILKDRPEVKMFSNSSLY